MAKRAPIFKQAFWLDSKFFYDALWERLQDRCDTFPRPDGAEHWRQM